jgi:hypothetical protein
MNKKQLILLYVISIIAVVICFLIDPIPQPQEYHHFADNVACCSIPNFWNVVSNLPFVIIGIVGLIKITSIKEYVLKSNYIWFFIGIFFTGFGSGYYHFNPNDTTLIWDRLPMTISFMSFMTIIIGEFINSNSGKKLLYPLLFTGVLSIVYWVVSGDLRFYALIQFLPILLILIILLLSKKEVIYKKYFWLIVVSYAIAKFFESYDVPIYTFTHKIISGHSLKHFAAAAGPFLFYLFVNKKFKLKK